MTTATATPELAEAMLTAALEYAAMGWPVFPCHEPAPDAPGGCTCGEPDCESPGKHPRTRHGFKDATTDTAQIRRWWQRWPTANVAIATGGASRLLVLDLDRKPAGDGRDSIAKYEAEHGALPETPGVRTGSGGEHLFFLMPDDGGPELTIGNGVLPGVDYRGTGGYVVAAPSRHPSGDIYLWKDGCSPRAREVVVAPGWLMKLLRNPPRRKGGGDSTAAGKPRPNVSTDLTTRGYTALTRVAAAYALNAESHAEGTRNTAAFRLAGHLRAFEVRETGQRLTEGEVRELVKRWNERNNPPLAETEIEAAVASAYQGHGVPPATKYIELDDHNPATRKSYNGTMPTAEAVRMVGEAPGFNLTDEGNAERLIAQHGDDLLWCEAWQKWLVWNGQRWRVDDTREVERRAKLTVRSIYAEAAGVEDDKRRAALVEHARKSESERALRAMVSLARKDVAITPAHLDADPWLLNVTNGTIDLRTGELREHRRADRLTKMAPVEYDPDATLPEWDRFLRDATDADADLLGFLQRSAGYSLTGDVREERMFLVHGPAAAGKTTFVEAVMAALGDYAYATDFCVFLAQREDSRAASPDLAALDGPRFIVANEVRDGARLSEARVKKLCGGDTITARRLYAEPHEFRMQGKLWLVCNDAPHANGRDDALWRRVLKIPFEHTVPPEQRDPALKRALCDPEVGGPAVLAWAVRGCLEWQRVGLDVPGVVASATDAYRRETDSIAAFIAEAIVFGVGAWAVSGEVWEAYVEFCEQLGHKPESRKALGVALSATGAVASAKRVSGRSVRVWEGFGLREVEERCA